MKLLEKAISLVGPDFNQRIQRKLKEIYELSHNHNKHFKPTGLYQTSRDYFNEVANSGAEVYDIYPQYVSSLNISQEMYQSVSKYARPDQSVTTDYLVVKIPDGRLYTNNMGSIAIISRDNKMIGDVSFQYSNGKVTLPKDNLIFSQKHFEPPLKLPGVVFSMLSGGGAINNYGHWLMDSLPRLHLLQKSGLYNQVDWFLVPSLMYDYQKDTLKLLGIPDAKIIEGDKIRHIHADFLIASTAPRGNDTLIPQWLFEFLRTSFGAKAEFSSKFPSRIHISRKDSNFRKVINEDKLVELITPYGFETITLSSYSFREKVNLFANADVVLGASGAGLVNSFFCRKGTTLIELFSEGFVFPDNYDVASQGGLDYHYLISASALNVKSKGQGQRSSMTVDLKRLKQLLDNVLINTIR